MTVAHSKARQRKTSGRNDEKMVARYTPMGMLWMRDLHETHVRVAKGVPVAMRCIIVLLTRWRT